VKILVAEDDVHIREGLIEVLESEGYEVVAAADGKEALRLYYAEQPDLLCLDIMMPGMNGYDVCRDIRKKNATAPILFISAKSEEIDRVLGLEIGADDFIGKPFGVREVIARIRAVTRRALAASGSASETRPFSMGDLDILPSELRARRGETAIDLGVRDMSILKVLHERTGKVVTRDELFNRCWGLDHIPNSRTLDQHISQLRKRIEQDPKHPKIIRTVQGAGYRYEG
jgi:DNA-binding response OmpR family regulator